MFIVQAITVELYQLEGFESQFADMVAAATRDLQEDSAQQGQQLHRDEEKVAREMENLADAIAKLGARPLLQDKLLELVNRANELAAMRYRLQTRTRQPLRLPTSVGELRQLFEELFRQLTIDSPPFGDFLRQIVPEFDVYLVRLCDGGHLLPRARVRLDLMGSMDTSSDSASIPTRPQRVDEQPVLNLTPGRLVRRAGSGPVRTRYAITELPAVDHPVIATASDVCPALWRGSSCPACLEGTSR